MKYSKILYILIIAVVFTACKKDDEVPLTSLNVKNVEIVPSFTSADVRLNAGTNATMKDILLEYSTDSTFKEYREEKMTQTGKTGNQYQVTLSNLSDSTKYYIRCRATNKYSSLLGNYSGNFTTLTISIPEIGSVLISEVEYSTATCKVDSMDDGGSPVTKRGICYSTNPDPTVSDNLIERGSGTKTFTCALADLQDSTTYYVRAYATNIKGTAYSEEQSFTTKKYKTPTITTASVSNITYTTAQSGGEITDNGGQEVTECGICYATSPEPTISDSKVTSDTRTGSFTCNLTELKDGTTYYVRAYATNNIGTAYGNEVTFTTKAYKLPTLTTTSVSNISYTTATTGGNVTSDGEATVTARGVCYSTTSNPTISNSKVTSGSGTGSFTCNLTGLKDGTKYYVRAYATNSKGTAYGEEKTFTTTAYSAPTVTTTSASNITQTTATCGGNVTADGGQTVTARGVCYSTTSNPTISNSKVTSGSGTGSFTCNLTGLTAGTKYYVRAYATNSKGTAYGTEKTFTTTADLTTQTITYTASAKLTETTGTYSSGLHTNAFNVTISSHSFSNGTGIIIFNGELTSIGDRAFYHCDGLTSVTIPNSVTSIGDYAFFYCKGLTSVTIPNSVTSIGNSAFYGCDGLTSVTIPNSVTGIGSLAFGNCSGLTSISVASGNSKYSSSNGVLFNYNKTTLIQYPAGKSGSYSIPNSVTSIGSYAFYYCKGLTSITIPNSVTSIGSYAFENCSGLTSITIPNSVTSIGSWAFDGCTGLTSITCNATTPPTCGSYAFYNVTTSIPVYVPAASVSAYKAAYGWKDFTNFKSL